MLAAGVSAERLSCLPICGANGNMTQRGATSKQSGWSEVSRPLRAYARA
jgi:hypothetical protein